VKITDHGLGPVHLAVARPLGSDEYWYVISDESTDVKTVEEYGLRFDIEENFLDDKSNGFQLEESLIDQLRLSSAYAWSWRSRLCIWSL
jgi:hypothetical protein